MNDLLKVLNLESEERQIKALYEMGYTEYFAKRKCGDGFKYECRTGSLADLAFRLRDKEVEIDWVSWQIASAHVWGVTDKSDYNPGKFGNRATPIHWVIASLIAKGATNENSPLCYRKREPIQNSPSTQNSLGLGMSN